MKQDSNATKQTSTYVRSLKVLDFSLKKETDLSFATIFLVAVAWSPRGERQGYKRLSLGGINQSESDRIHRVTVNGFRSSMPD